MCTIVSKRKGARFGVFCVLSMCLFAFLLVYRLVCQTSATGRPLCYAISRVLELRRASQITKEGGQVALVLSTLFCTRNIVRICARLYANAEERVLEHCVFFDVVVCTSIGVLARLSNFCDSKVTWSCDQTCDRVAPDISDPEEGLATSSHCHCTFLYRRYSTYICMIVSKRRGARFGTSCVLSMCLFAFLLVFRLVCQFLRLEGRFVMPSAVC